MCHMDNSTGYQQSLSHGRLSGQLEETLGKESGHSGLPFLTCKQDLPGSQKRCDLKHQWFSLHTLYFLTRPTPPGLSTCRSLRRAYHCFEVLHRCQLCPGTLPVLPASSKAVMSASSEPVHMFSLFFHDNIRVVDHFLHFVILRSM